MLLGVLAAVITFLAPFLLALPLSLPGIRPGSFARSSGILAMRLGRLLLMLTCPLLGRATLLLHCRPSFWRRGLSRC